MAKIFLIPSHVISQIAAGEVIERPVYAVKELVENALDAGASRITVQIEASGLKKIVVTDDGEGMNKDDLLQSFKPHTTSKLIDESLVGIQTLGFRGEALASIAAISTMTLQSRARDQKVGTKVTIVAGNVQSTEPVGMPAGTSVTVENLFYTVPARKKFLKS
ncbi:MAG TPA: DNA mismatch repair endonuclease MutL, partial [Candidatus Levybacteria bacterium]|nr:DNA mismatch repair endonuclease MutL [Candidatus Levybacteria bacterium]